MQQTSNYKNINGQRWKSGLQSNWITSIKLNLFYIYAMTKRRHISEGQDHVHYTTALRWRCCYYTDRRIFCRFQKTGSKCCSWKKYKSKMNKERTALCFCFRMKTLSNTILKVNTSICCLKHYQMTLISMAALFWWNYVSTRHNYYHVTGWPKLSINRQDCKTITK